LAYKNTSDQALPTAAGSDATAVGYGATASGAQAIAFGLGATASGASTVALGDMAIATGPNATAVGAQAIASGFNSYAGGYQSSATGGNAVAVGSGSFASGQNALALGAGASATAPNSVALGAGSIANQPNTVSVGAPGAERRITNVAAGVAPTDAVNVSQLNAVVYSTDQRLALVSRQSRAGTAMGLAAAGLPQAFTAGKSLVAGAVGTYGGETSFAFGVSKIFDDGHTILKGGVTVDTQHTVGGNIGIGYQW